MNRNSHHLYVPIAILLGFLLVFSSVTDGYAISFSSVLDTDVNYQNQHEVLADPAESEHGANVEVTPTISYDPSIGLISSDGYITNSPSGRVESGDGYSDAVVYDESVLEFLYVDDARLESGAIQNVALGVTSDSVDLQESVLYYQDDNGNQWSVGANNVIEQTALFSFVPGDGDPGEYSLSHVELHMRSSDSAKHFILFSSIPDSTRSFQVVTGAASALSEDTADKDDVSIYTLGDDGLVERASVDDALAVVVSEPKSRSNRSMEGEIVVALDPGHGGYDPGAQGFGLSEKDINWKIAQYCKAELEQYNFVSVVMTRAEDECPSLAERAQRAASAGASVLISIHINSTGYGGATGAEVWVPNESNYNYGAHTVGEVLGERILNKLSALGLANRGVKTRNYPIDYSDPDAFYPDGSIADYYGVIRESRRLGIPGIIVEHAFIDNQGDAAFLSSDANLQNLGIADATAIADHFGLVKGPLNVYQENSDPERGTVDVLFKDPRTYGEIENVAFEVYSNRVGSEVTLWLQGTRDVEGNWVATIEASNFKMAQGAYIVRAYANIAGQNGAQIVGNALIQMETTPLVSAELSEDGAAVVLSASSGDCGGSPNVSFQLSPAAGGGDVWIAASELPDGSWLLESRRPSRAPSRLTAPGPRPRGRRSRAAPPSPPARPPSRSPAPSSSSPPASTTPPRGPSSSSSTPSRRPSASPTSRSRWPPPARRSGTRR